MYRSTVCEYGISPITCVLDTDGGKPAYFSPFSFLAGIVLGWPNRQFVPRYCFLRLKCFLLYLLLVAPLYALFTPADDVEETCRNLNCQH
jgi:hypothetical protein